MTSGERSSEANLYRFMFIRYLGIDVFVGVLLATLWLLIYETPDLQAALIICATLYGLRFGAWVLYLRVALGPIVHWQRADEVDEATLRSISQRLQGLTFGLTAIFGVGWLGYFLVLAALSWWVFPEAISIGRAELPAAIAQGFVTVTGAMVLYPPLTRVMLDAPLARLDDELAQRGLEVTRPRVPLTRRLVIVGAVLIMGPISWYASVAWLDAVSRARVQAVTELRATIELAARDQAAGAVPVGAEIVDTPPETLAAPGEDARETRTWVDPRREHALVAVALDDGRWLVATRAIEFGAGRVLGLFGMFVFIALVWGLSTILVQARSIMLPLGRLQAATGRIVEVGDLRAMRRVPIVLNDEVGDLSEDFNRVLQTFEQLATAVEAVAAGDLTVVIENSGDLPAALMAMVEQFHAVVSSLRETSVQLASATAEIQAASGEQERAAERQISEMRQLELGVSSLAGLATNIDDAGTDVLANAERALANMDEMAAQIAALGEHVAGIDALLDQIREIANRSDILALNGSLEATRAGEGGRGFALVSAEMRRLAERVTGTVTHVRELIVDIDAANANTVETTARSRELAKQTASAARSIATLTRRQSEDMGRASTGVREVAEILSLTSVATTQTRAIAESLQLTARELQEQLAKFELRPDE